MSKCTITSPSGKTKFQIGFVAICATGDLPTAVLRDLPEGGRAQAIINLPPYCYMSVGATHDDTLRLLTGPSPALFGLE